MGSTVRIFLIGLGRSTIYLIERAAVKTHTGSVAGSMDIFRAAVRTVGGIFVDNIEDMLNLAKIVLSAEPVSNDVLIITNSGGHGVLTTDAIDKEGLNEIELPERVKHDLLSVIPEQSTPRNPIDLSGDADYARYNRARCTGRFPCNNPSISTSHNISCSSCIYFLDCRI